MDEDLIAELRACRDPLAVAALLRRCGCDNGYAFQAAVVRCRFTPLGEALRLFWWFNPEEGDLAFDRTTEVAGLQLELIKRVEIGYYPKAGVRWSYFDESRASDDADTVLESFQGIVPRCMLGTEFS